MDPRTPVLVGVSQLGQRPEDPCEAVEPLELMHQVLSNAITNDAGAPRLGSELGAIAVVAGAWSYSNPARLLANRLGANRALTILSHAGGNTPQALVNAMAGRIQAGQLDSVAIVGGETIWSRRRQRRTNSVVPRTKQRDSQPDERFQDELSMSTEFETERGMEAPINYYPLFESAIRAKNNETFEQHRLRLGHMWARFNSVAVTNPYAWTRTPLTANLITTPSPTNRMVGFPYTKAMNSNWDLDQAAALVLCSVATADRIGIARDRWVFPLAGTDANDTYAVSERRDLHSSPAIAEAGLMLQELSGQPPAEATHIDVYSCFPSAVQVAATELGLDQETQLTVTGGLTFAGGPLNNYVTHSIATMVGLLRGESGSTGLITANGGYLTKHSLGMYASTPPSRAFGHANVQDRVDPYPTTRTDTGYRGSATIEAYTVMHDQDGPIEALAALRTPHGARTWGRSDNGATVIALLDDEGVGRSVNLGGSGHFTLTED